MGDESPPEMTNKKYKVKVLQREATFSLMQLAGFAVLFGFVGGYALLKSFAAKPPANSPTYTPMAVQYENFQDQSSPNANQQGGCVGTDDFLDWNVAGSLKPEKAYTFTPTHPTCASAETPVAFSHLNWDASQLELSTTVPNKDSDSQDPAQIGKTIAAGGYANQANACMFFNSLSATGLAYSYSFTVKNTGTQTAYNVSLKGGEHNGWVSQEYNDCARADADHDGWSDALEYSMETEDNVDCCVTNAYLGTNYLRVTGTNTPNDEADFYPPDFNDDNQVNQADVDTITSYLGQGNGIGLAELTNHYSTDPTDMNHNKFAWRRYDLDGDGMVTNKDVDMVKRLVGQPIPMTTDILAPSVKIKAPSGTVAKGAATQITTYGFDNNWLTKVEVYINGKLTYTSQSPSVDNYWWQVPRKGGTYTIMSKAYDAAGNTGTDSVTITAQ